MNRNVALVYVRVSRSDEDERERKISPDMQREKAIALRELQGLEVLHFEDLDISGKATANRPQYLALLERLRAGGVRYVVAYDLSRITRTLRDQADFFEALGAAGALFLEASTGRTVDVSDENDEMLANVLGSLNQHFRRALSRKVRDALASKVASGQLVGPVPAGYLRRREILENGKIARTWVEIDPEKAPIIQLLFREYATDRYSLKSLARELNARGIPQPRPRHFRNNRAAAAIWTSDVVKDLVSNPRYAGRIPGRDGKTYDAACTAIIDAETFATCERIRMRRRAQASLGRSGKRKWLSPYLLSGVLRCRRCGSTMSGESWRPDHSHPEPRYRYTCYRRRTAQLCDAPYVTQDVLEVQVLEILRAVRLPAGFAEGVDAVATAVLRDARPTEPRATPKELQRRLVRLKTLYELGDLELEEYVRRRDALQADIEAAEHGPRPALEGQQRFLGTLLDEWPELTTEERKRLFAFVFEEIHADVAGVTKFRATEDWRPYMRTSLAALGNGGVSERKTGLEPATLTLAR